MLFVSFRIECFSYKKLLRKPGYGSLAKNFFISFLLHWLNPLQHRRWWVLIKLSLVLFIFFLFRKRECEFLFDKFYIKLLNIIFAWALPLSILICNSFLRISSQEKNKVFEFRFVYTISNQTKLIWKVSGQRPSKTIPRNQRFFKINIEVWKWN